MKAFDRYGGKDGALAYAEKLVPDLAKGSQVTALSPSQANDALAALEQLAAFRRSTGRGVSLLGAVSEYAAAASKLNGRTLSEAVDGYLGTVADVKRKDIIEAVEDFLAVQAPLARSSNGERSQISSKYHYNREIQLRRFADTFPNSAVCDLTNGHLDTFLFALAEFSAKTRNHNRATIRQFLEWANRPLTAEARDERPNCAYRPSTRLRGGIGVLEKCGFSREGVLPRHTEFPNLGQGVCDVFCHALLCEFALGAGTP